MEEPRPLGSLSSWIRDGVCAGALIPAGILLALVGLAYLDRHDPNLKDFPEILVASILTGVCAGLIVAPIAHGLALISWRIPLLTLALGPLFGAIAARLSLEIVARMVDERPPEFHFQENAIVLGYGAFVIGPPWVSYVAVRSKGRSGLPVIAASSLWASSTILIVIGLAWLRRFGAFPP